MVAYAGTEEMKQQYDLHSLHKSSRILKKPQPSVAATGPNAQQPKVYKVKPIHFRELVQKLTGAHPDLLEQTQTQSQTPPRPLSQPQSQPRRNTLQSLAPPPLPLHPHQLHLQNEIQTSNLEKQVPIKLEQALSSAPLDQNSFDKKQGWEGTELTLSPNFQAWFTFAMLSPGPATVSQMEQRSQV